MPTDENNGVNPQNQHVDPNLAGNQSVPNSGASDDFDFNFDDSNNNQDTQTGTGLSGDMQDQMRRQGRSGMFLTPDEAITKSNEDNDMSLGNIDISSTVQPQQRSGMFLTPDEEANKEESQIEGKQYSFQGVDESQGVNDTDSDDSYLAGIDPEDVEDSQDGSSDDGQQETPVQDNDYSQDKLDDEIEDLISFGDEPKADNVDQGSAVDQTVVQPEDINKEVEIGATPSVKTAVEQPVDAVVQPEQSVESVELKTEEQNNELVQNIQEGQDSQIVQDGVGNIGVENGNVEGEVITESKGGDSEDRLSQEDKKVEESFGTASESISSDIDVSPESVGQNVENVINEPVDTPEQNVGSDIIGNVNLDVNVQPVEQNDLHIENMGTDVVENGNGDLISDTGGMQQMGQENTYVPNEAEFNQMSDILNSSSTGQVDLSNLNPEQSAEQVIEQEKPISTTPVSENAQVEIVVPTLQDNGIQSELENNVNEELSKFEGVESQVTPQAVQQEMPQVDQQEVSSNVSVSGSNSEINLDSLVAGTEPVNQTVLLDNNTNSDTNNGSLIGAVNEGTVVEQSNQTVPQKKRKKQSGFTVMGIFLGVLLLGVGGYIAAKMFPDKFANIFSNNNSVSQQTYTYGDFEYTIDGLYLDVYPEDSSKTITVVETGEDYTMTTADNEDTINYLNGKPAKTIPLSTDTFIINPEYKEGKYTIYDMSFVDLNLNLSKADLESLLEDEIKGTTVDKSYIVEVVLKYKLNKYPANFKYFKNMNTWRFTTRMFSFLNPSLMSEDGNDMFDVNIGKSISQVINIAVISKEDDNSDTIIEYGDDLGDEELGYLLNYLMLSEEEIDNEPDASKMKCIMFYTVDSLEGLIDKYNGLDMINGDGNFSFSTEINNEGLESGEEYLDPNSLAGLLENNGEDSEDGQEEVSDGEDIEDMGGEEKQNNDIETQSGDDTVSGVDDFDPFAGIDEILGEGQEYIDKLNSYVASGQYYIEWGENNSGESNGKFVVAAGRNIVSIAQEELTKLENGEEIDTTAFDRMDELLKKLSDLENKS